MLTSQLLTVLFNCCGTAELTKHDLIGTDLFAEDTRRIVQEKDAVIVQLQQQVMELELRCQFLEMAGHDGVLLWKIGSVQQRISDAREGRVVSLYSQPFYAGRYGYKLCARVYFNGDGDGYGTHVSLFFVVMRASKRDCMSSLALFMLDV